MESLRRGDGQRSAVRDAVLQVMLPLAELLLGVRMGVGDCMALAKLAYVQAAMVSARKSGDAERPSLSRIATETGLTRQEVAKLLRRKVNPLPVRRGRSRADRVLAGWWNDPEFQDGFGRPALLSLRGPVPSLVTLTERYGFAGRAAPIVEELERADAIRRMSDGRYQALKRTCVNVTWDEDSIRSLGAQVRRLFDALMHNLRDVEEDPLFARVVESDALSADYIPVLMKALTQDSEILLEGASDKLSKRRYAAKGPDAKGAPRIVLAVQVLKEAASGSRRGRVARGGRTARARSKSPSGVGAS